MEQGPKVCFAFLVLMCPRMYTHVGMHGCQFSAMWPRSSINRLLSITASHEMQHQLLCSLTWTNLVLSSSNTDVKFS